MIIYNVTVGIDSDVEMDWVRWMKDTHIPEVMATGSFSRYDMFKVLSHEGEGASYAVQYVADSMDKVDHYLSKYAPELMRVHMEKFKNKHVAFRTLLERID